MSGDNTLHIPFDQYQRYKTAELIVNDFRDDEETFLILEIGANEHKNLEMFLPNDIVKYLDIQLSEELKIDPNYILADATNMPEIATNSFDIVIALDVFEHIPKELREKFLTELNRVAKKVVILAGPFSENEVNETEIRVNEYFKIKFGFNYIWLNEHINNGLPTVKDTVKFLSTNKKKITHFKHGSLYLWEKLMKLHFEEVQNYQLHRYVQSIFTYYNKYLFDKDISKNSSYRDFLVCSDDIFNYEKYFNQGPETNQAEIDILVENIEAFFLLSNTNMKNQFTQLFLDQGNGISEENSPKLPIAQNNESQIFTFDLTGYEDLTSLRFDPLNDSCVIEIKELKIIRLDGSELDLTSRISANDLTHHGKSYFFDFHDPIITFEGLGTEDLTGAAKLTATIRYAHIGRDALVACIDQTKAELDQTKAELDQTKAELDQTKKNPSWRITKLARSIKQILKGN